VNEAARMYADGWDVERTTVLEHQCQPYTMPYLFHGPLQFRVWEERQPDSQELIAIKFYIGTYQQWRTIWMDGRPHPPEYAPHTFVGFSTGEFNGDILTVNTTHIKAGFFRRTGVPESDRTTVVEHWMRHGTLLSQVTIATDPVYLSEPYIRSQEFVLMERGNQNWLYNCEYVTEVARDRTVVPHFLPGENPFLREFAAKHAMPQEGVRGGAETLLPGWKPGAPPLPPVAAKNGGFTPEQQESHLAPGDVRAVPVQGNVYLVVGAGTNIAVQVGEDGLIVVDTGATATDKALTAIKELAKGKEIRWIVNTSFRPDHTAGNEAFSSAGRTVNGNPAAIVAHENAAARMAQTKVPDSARPFNTYFEETRDFPFNGEPVVLYHHAAVTDTDTLVMFRRSDVIAAGEAYSTVSYPMIDLANGGSVQGAIDALNRILQLAIPSKNFEEGGTYVIPGRGRISDEHDVAMYRDMVTIIRDRIKALVAKKKSLAEVLAARPTLDYDGRYGEETGPWTTKMFIEAVYQDLSKP
jgi:cyclase